MWQDHMHLKKNHQTNNQRKETQWIRNSQNNLLRDKQNINILLIFFLLNKQSFVLFAS